MNSRPHLIEAAEAFDVDFNVYDKALKPEFYKRYQYAIKLGRKQGIAMERSRVRKIGVVVEILLGIFIYLIVLAAILTAYWITSLK